MKDNLKIIFLILLLVCALGLFVQSAVHGEDNITTGPTTFSFPIAALGNCQNPTACKTYCDQSQNHAACLSFAQSHRMTPATATVSGSLSSQQFLSDAKTILGCDGYTACKSFCQTETNHSKCTEFSQHERNYFYYRLNPSQSSSLSTLLFQATQKELGCNSDDSCKSFCSQSQNIQKCSVFITSHRLAPNQNPSPVGPRTDQPLIYPNASPSSRPSSTNPQSWGVPAGVCTTTQDCYSYCYNHPESCPTFPFGRVTTNGVPPSSPNQNH